MKKGFTIVELAVVIVVVGIVLAMAVKGKQLVESAKIKSYLAQFMKYEAAAHTYYSMVNSLPPVTGGVSDVNSHVFIDRGLLTLRDLEEPTSAGRWRFAVCTRDVSSPWLADPLGAYLCAYHDSVHAYSVCLFELHLDDFNPVEGSARVWNYDSLVHLIYDNKDCDYWKVEGRFQINGGYEQYSYRAF